MPLGQQLRQRDRDRGVHARHRLRSAEGDEKPIVRPEAEGATSRLSIDALERPDRRAGHEAVTRECVEGRREADRHPGRELADGSRRSARLYVALPYQRRNAARPGGEDEGQGKVPAGGEERRGPQPAEQPPGLRDRCQQPRRIEDGVHGEPRRAQRAHDQLVVAKLAAQRVAGHEPVLEAAHAADVVELTAGPCVAECPCDGQRGVDVPACPAARYRIPHRVSILSGRFRG